MLVQYAKFKLDYLIYVNYLIKIVKENTSLVPE